MSSDSNEYLCKLLPEQSILKVNLRVNGPHKSITVTARNLDVTNKTIHFNPKRPGREFGDGNSLELMCHPEGGNPQGTVQWTHNSHTTKDAKLVIKEVTKKNAGLYQCLADNKRGKPIHASVELIVQRKYST